MLSPAGSALQTSAHAQSRGGGRGRVFPPLICACSDGRPCGGRGKVCACAVWSVLWRRAEEAAEDKMVLSPVTVLYFAKSAELAGVRSETISVPQEIKSLQLWEEIESRHPRLADVRDQVIFAVRQEYVQLGDQVLLLQPGDEIAIIPPISGG
uniref:Molybdopterin synthase sulfur carrier subunit n=2 Tax=Ornithorhynchus anatinus TaxID=9258 RepID=A0A6I8PI06_ORNAN